MFTAASQDNVASETLLSRLSEQFQWELHHTTIVEEEGKGARRTRRKMVAGLHFIASRWLSRVPALPPIARQWHTTVLV